MSSKLPIGVETIDNIRRTLSLLIEVASCIDRIGFKGMVTFIVLHVVL
jgi:hypothetical protein